MELIKSIDDAIASLCGDIQTHYDADDNKKRAEAIAILTLCQRLLPYPEPEEEQHGI